jgi:hypothetical protein
MHFAIYGEVPRRVLLYRNRTAQTLALVTESVGETDSASADWPTSNGKPTLLNATHS